MTRDDLVDALVPLAAELIGCVRDFGPDDVAHVLARVPEGRHDALAVILAAMVDPDTNTAQLLAWTHAGPVKSRDLTPHHLTVKRAGRGHPSKWSERAEEVARLTRLGWSAIEIAERLGTTPRSINRYRASLREVA